MKFSLKHNSLFGIAVSLVCSMGVAQAQLGNQTGTTTPATGSSNTKLPGSFGGLGVTGQSKIDFSGKDPSTAFNNGSAVSGATTGSGTTGTGLAGQTTGSQFGATGFSNATGTGAIGTQGGGLGNAFGGGLGGGFGRGGFGGLGGLGGLGGGGMGNTAASAKKLIKPIIRPDIEVERPSASTTATNAQLRLTRIQMPKRLKSVVSSVDGDFVVLRGQVATESDKRMGERLVKLEPGIDSVRNEVTVLTSPAESIRAKPTR